MNRLKEIFCIIAMCLLGSSVADVALTRHKAFAEKSSVPEELTEKAPSYTGNLDEMLDLNRIRVLVSYSKTFYFLDGPDQRGLTYETFSEFEKLLNEKLQRKNIEMKIVFIPLTRDELIPALVEGYGDVVAANLTITPERQEVVDFSDPYLTEVDEIVVTGPESPSIASLDDLAGQEIFVRESSSYYEHLLQLNAKFKEDGKTEMRLTLADEVLEDEDLLEMLNAGLIPTIVVDSHKAEFWAQIFDKITLHPEIAIHTGGEIAWAIRKESPQLRDELNAFIKEHKKGTEFGNIMFKRYLENTKWVENAASQEEREKFDSMVALFKKYAGTYGFDHLMIGAQAYQESKLDQSVVSPAGAVGVMQILPSTAADPAVGIPDIQDLENNIHAGVKYLNHIYESNFDDAEMDIVNKGLFAFASYNAGPKKIKDLRHIASDRGLDPNVWFQNVERIAAEKIGRETVQYVQNIYKYYIAYKLLERQAELKQQAE